MRNFTSRMLARSGQSFFVIRVILSGMLLSSVVSADSNSVNGEEALQAAIENPLRTPVYSARDRYRHPYETLAFFGVEPSHSVVEIWPGAGWYSEILAPYLATKGRFYAAHFAAQSPAAYFSRSRAQFEQRVNDEPQLFKGMQITEFDPPGDGVAAPDRSVDFVLTFRNVHNWMKAGYAEAAFQQFYRMLKPGAVLGLVEHRARPGTSEAQMIESGYVTEQRVIELAAAAGFILEARSEINANPADSTDHPKGVWTLPPSLRLGEEMREHYLAIGESDRMTLKFRKSATEFSH